MTKYFKKIFKRDNGRCVYCCRDLMSDFEAFMIAEEDHLIPKSKDGPHEIQNIVTACAVCNRLKGTFIAEELQQLDDQESRREFIKKILDNPKSWRKYIEEVRAHIMERRAELMVYFASWTHPQ